MKSLLFSNKWLIVPIVIAVAAIALPAVIVWRGTNFLYSIAQVLFDIILAAASIWIGDAISKQRAEKQAADKWIPAAESASKALLAISTTIDRMRYKQGKACEVMAPILSSVPTKQRMPVEMAMKMRCDACSEGLSNLKFHIDNSFSDWDTFIEMNCDDKVCIEVHKRLDEKRQELAKIMKKDFPEAALSV